MISRKLIYIILFSLFCSHFDFSNAFFGQTYFCKHKYKFLILSVGAVLLFLKINSSKKTKKKEIKRSPSESDREQFDLPASSEYDVKTFDLGFIEIPDHFVADADLQKVSVSGSEAEPVLKNKLTELKEQFLSKEYDEFHEKWLHHLDNENVGKVSDLHVAPDEIFYQTHITRDQESNALVSQSFMHNMTSGETHILAQGKL